MANHLPNVCKPCTDTNETKLNVFDWKICLKRIISPEVDPLRDHFDFMLFHLGFNNTSIFLKYNMSFDKHGFKLSDR